MIDRLMLTGSHERRVVVQTRKGTNLTSFVAPEPEFQQIEGYRRLLQKYGRAWEPRKPATGGYNCAGHVWASRRAALPMPSEWRTILAEDGYRRLATEEIPYPDDIVLYVEEPDNEIMHVARIVEVREGVTPNSPRIPWAVSKWHLRSGEVVHNVYDVPYEQQYGQKSFSFRTEFWTDRPNDGETSRS